jgi:hypothetical protein
VFKYILVPATGTDADGPVFATAVAIARLMPAHLEFLHVRLDVQDTLLAMATNDISGGAGYDQLLETLESEVATRQKAVEQALTSAKPRNCPRPATYPLRCRRWNCGWKPATNRIGSPRTDAQPTCLWLGARGRARPSRWTSWRPA